MTEHTTPQNIDPVAMIDRVGRTWGRDLIGGIDGSVGLCFRHPDVAQAHPLEELRERYGPLSELYAHPPVTAEPATAPSVEQIAEVQRNHRLTKPGIAKPWHCHDSEGLFCRTYARDDTEAMAEAKHDLHVAEAIHALYGTEEPNDPEMWAMKWRRDAEKAEKRVEAVEAARAEARDRAEKAEARVKELESGPRVDMYEAEDGVAEIDGVLWVPSKDLDAMREEEEAAAAAQQDRLEALRRSQEFIGVREPETRVSASLLLSAVRWVLTGQVDD